MVLFAACDLITGYFGKRFSCSRVYLQLICYRNFREFWYCWTRKGCKRNNKSKNNLWKTI